MEPDHFGKLFRYQEFGPDYEFNEIRDVIKNFGEGTEVHVYKLNKHEDKYVLVDKQLSKDELKAVIAMYELKADGLDFLPVDIYRLTQAYESRSAFRQAYEDTSWWDDFEDYLGQYTWEIWLQSGPWFSQEIKDWKEAVR